MLQTHTTTRTHLIAISIAALMTFTIIAGVPTLGQYEASRASIAINMERSHTDNDVITVIGHRQHRGEAAHTVGLADSTGAGFSCPCAK